MAELESSTERRRNGANPPTEPEETRILDDSPLTAQPYRMGDVFDLYESGAGVKFKVTEIVERDGRRITYGTPA